MSIIPSPCHQEDRKNPTVCVCVSVGVCVTEERDTVEGCGWTTCHFLLTDGPLAGADSPVAVISFRHPALFTSL